MKWFTEEEFLKVTVEGNGEVFNEILDRVYNKAIEQALCHIPDIVNKLSKKVNAINKTLDKYFQDNPMFLEYKDIVIKVISEIEIEHTGMLFEEVIEAATPIISKRIENVKSGGSNANL